MRVAFYLNGSLVWADKRAHESPLAAATRSIARRLGADVTVWYDRAATLARGDGHDVHRVQWFDGEAYRESALAISG